MSDSTQEPQRRVLIASANPLFARGLQRMVAKPWGGRRVEVRMAESMAEAIAALETWKPDLVIVDYDDIKPGAIQRAEFLSHFIAEERPMQVMLVSLRESGEVVVYDRRTLTPAQAEDWLELPWMAEAMGPVTGGAPAREPEPEAGAPAQAEPIDQPGANALAGTPALAGAYAYSGSGGNTNVLSETLSSPRSGGMKHYVIAGIITAIVTVLSYLVLTNIGLLPVAAATQAGPVDRMVNLQLWMIAFLFSLITVFIGYSAVVFRARKGEKAEGAYFSGSTGLEVVWTIFPLVTVIALSFLGAQALGEVRTVDPQALTVNVIGFQWGWTFEYPDYGIQSNELYLPVGRQVRLLMSSRDVIHSFWVPEFRVKQDVLPGENLIKELRITPNQTGDYQVMCAELCGGAHAYMNSPVRVVQGYEFDEWVNAQGADLSSMPPAERGQRASNAAGCLACHSLDGSQLAGPTWLGLAGSEVQLQDGGVVTADDEYLYNSIVEPNQQIHAGFPPIMPQNYEDSLSEEQIRDIIEFIKTVQ